MVENPSKKPPTLTMVYLGPHSVQLGILRGPSSAHLPPGLEMVGEGRLSLLYHSVNFSQQLNCMPKSQAFVKGAFLSESDNLD